MPTRSFPDGDAPRVRKQGLTAGCFAGSTAYRSSPLERRQPIPLRH